VLAVGDEAFQGRCIDRVRTFQKEGRTIVLVTHALDMARQICDRAAMLDHGLVHAIGSPDEVVREMRLTILRHDLEFAGEEGTREIEIFGGGLLRGLDPLDGPLAPGESVAIQVDLKANEPVDDPVVSFALHDGANNFVFGGDTSQHGAKLGLLEGKRRVRFQLGPVPFTGGQYWVTVGVHSRDNQRIYHVQDQRYSFEVRQLEGRRDQTFMPVGVEVEDL
jgi:ABC-2 type transport system ATP-binding protein